MIVNRTIPSDLGDIGIRARGEFSRVPVEAILLRDLADRNI